MSHTDTRAGWRYRQDFGPPNQPPIPFSRERGLQQLSPHPKQMPKLSAVNLIEGKEEALVRLHAAQQGPLCSSRARAQQMCGYPSAGWTSEVLFGCSSS